jgi:hypothetical protein
VSRTNLRERVRALPLGLIGALALVIITERAISRDDLEFTETTPTNWAFSKRASKSIAPRTDILFFGTSLIKFGVLPKAVESATGLSAYNLAANSGHMPTSYFLFKRALDAGARPKAVVVDCEDAPVWEEVRDQQAEALRVNLRNWPELLDLRECLDLSWNARDADFLTTMLVSRVLPSFKARFDIRKSILGAFKGHYLAASGRTMVYLRNWNVNLGAYVMPPTFTLKSIRDLFPLPPEDAGDPFAEGKWSRNRLTERYTRRFLELAAAHDIPVFWLLPPIPPREVIARRAIGLDRYFDDLARSAQQIYPNVTVIDGTRSNYTPDTFYDDAHLNSKGSVAFSESLAFVLAQSLATRGRRPRWIWLPDYAPSDRPTNLRFEDMDGSRLAVKEGRTGARR